MAANATLITNPALVSQWLPAYNPIIVTASSTNTAEPNFRYIVQIVFTYPVSVTKTIKLSARPDGFLLFDAHRIVENYISFDFSVGDATDAIECANSFAIFDIQIGVEYGTTPTEYLNLDSTGDLYAAPASVKHSVSSFGGETDFINLVMDTQYHITNGTTSTTRKFLTSSPRTITLCSDNNYYLYITTKNEPIKLRLKVYDENGGLLSTNYKTLTTGFDGEVVRFGVGTKNINEWNIAYLIGASYYEITLCNVANAALGETFTFTIDCDCTKFNESFRLHWLNPLGGFDAHTFNQRFDRNMNLKKANYTKILGEMSGGGAYTYTPSQAGKMMFDTRTTEKVTINTNWITEAESIWLFTLAKSTQVFWEIDADTYAPVVITDTQYQQKTYAGEKLFNVEMTMEIGNEIMSQRG